MIRPVDGNEDGHARPDISEGSDGDRRQAAPPRRRGRPKGDDRLSRDQIVAAAIDLVASGPVEGVSVRAIAAALGVSAMAIYNHVGGKSEIDHHVLAHLFRTEVRWVDITDRTDGPQILREMFTSQYKLASRYPNIFLVFAHHSMMPEVLRFQEQMYEGFRRCGLPRHLHRVWARIFGSFVAGSAELERVTHDASWEQLETAYVQLDTGVYPNLVRARKAAGADATAFSAELDALIEAMLLAVANHGGAPPPPAATAS